MIEVIKILHSNDFINVSEFVEIAKGKHEQVFTIKEVIKKIKRVWRLKKK